MTTSARSFSLCLLHPAGARRRHPARVDRRRGRRGIDAPSMCLLYILPPRTRAVGSLVSFPLTGGPTAHSLSPRQ